MNARHPAAAVRRALARVTSGWAVGEWRYSFFPHGGEFRW